MKSISTAIFAKCTSGTDLYTDLAGRLYKGRAPERTEYPYAVFKLISHTPQDQYTTFTEEYESILYQFDIFSLESSTSEIEAIYAHLTSLYNNKPLVVGGRTIHWMRWRSAVLIPEEHTVKTATKEVWHYAVEYEILEELRTGENEALFVDTESGTFEDTTDAQYVDR